MAKKIFTSLLLLLLGFVGAMAQNTLAKSTLIAEIDSILQTQIDQEKIPGAVILIKKGKEEIYKNAFGYAQKKNFEQQNLAVPEKTTVKHLYDIASLTKVVGTTTSIMLLVDKGLLKVDEPVGKYIPAFNSPDKAIITIRHLLTHTSGLYEWYPLYYRCKNRQETFKLIGELPLAFPVGSGRHYSDLGFTILGQLIEKVSRKSLEDFMAENIFKPLKMNHTMYNPLKNGFTKNIAATSHGNPYEKRMVTDSTLGMRRKEIDPNSWNGWRNYTLRGEVNDGNAWYANEGVSGAAGLFSTVEDLQKLVDVLKHKGKSGKKQFISESTIQLFLTKDQYKNGLGWMMEASNSFMKNAKEGTFGHTGFTGTSITVMPDSDLSIILLINRQNMGLLENKTYYNVNKIRELVFNAVVKYNASAMD